MLSLSPDETWLLLDSGQVLPVDRLSWELGIEGTLPLFEIWLSEDGSTWWNTRQVNGWNLEAGVEYTHLVSLQLGLLRDARGPEVLTIASSTRLAASAESTSGRPRKRSRLTRSVRPSPRNRSRRTCR